jgi:hypothetical protein
MTVMWRIRFVTRDWRRVLAAGLAALGTFWALLELWAFFDDSVESRTGWETFSGMLGLSMVIGIWKGCRPTSVEMMIPATGSRVEIGQGDLFQVDGLRVIPVNDFVDCQLGDYVAPESLHGQLIEKGYSGQQQTFCREASSALTGAEFAEETRPNGRNRRYEIGASGRIEVAGHRYLLTVLGTTNIRTLEVSATVHDLWTALGKMWKSARTHASGRVVVVPLMGAGLSKVSLPPRQLLEVLLTSLVIASKEGHVSEHVRIVLTRSHLEQVDLRLVVAGWQ